MKQFLEDAAATATLADDVRALLPAELGGWTLLLAGELGTGKSTFARALIRGLGHAGAVPSPTYTLVEPYELPCGSVYHIDLYRVSEEAELGYLGYYELDEGLRIIEWPERAPGLARRADLGISFAIEGSGRTATVEGLSDRGRHLVRDLARRRQTPPGRRACQ